MNTDGAELSVEQILEALLDPKAEFPADALRQAGAHRAALTEALLAELAVHTGKILNNPNAEWDGRDHVATSAMYLLAQFREPRALPYFLSLCRLPEDLSDHWLGDMLSQDFASLLASTCGGDAAPLQALAEDAAVNKYGRWAAQEALIILTHAGHWPRAEMIEWLLRRCETEPREAGNAFWEVQLASAAYDLAAPELLPALREAYALQLADGHYISLEELEQRCHWPVSLARDLFSRSRHYVTDAAQDMAWMARASTPDKVAGAHWDEQAGGYWDEDFVPETYVRESPKIGRNEPCPCGSGKKFKKCCMDKPFPALPPG